jgi:hypothetical protein
MTDNKESPQSAMKEGNSSNCAGGSSPSISQSMAIDATPYSFALDPKITENFKTILQGYQNFFTEFAQNAQTVQSNLNTAFQGIASMIPKDLWKGIERFNEWQQQWPEATKRGAIRLAELGWHMGPELGINDLAWAYQTDSLEEVDTRFAEAFEECVDSTERWICERFPARAVILQDAFEAHRKGKFGLAIPVFFAQAEGMCRDSLKEDGNLFTTSDGAALNRMRRIKTHSNEVSAFIDVLLDPLGRVLPMGAKIEDSINFPRCPNRHAILHGYSLDYATRVNSLKAISLLAYLGWMLPELGGGHRSDA